MRVFIDGKEYLVMVYSTAAYIYGAYQRKHPTHGEWLTSSVLRKLTAKGKAYAKVVDYLRAEYDKINPDAKLGIEYEVAIKLRDFN